MPKQAATETLEADAMGPADKEGEYDWQKCMVSVMIA